MSVAAGGDSNTVVIVGAGLAGAMAALHFARRRDGGKQYKVILVERRPDFRKQRVRLEQTKEYGASIDSLKRSINLALSERGRSALRSVGLEKDVLQFCIPMKQRAMHPKSAKGLADGLVLQPYDQSFGRCIYSVSREELSRVLLDRLESHHADNVELMFCTKLDSMAKDGALTLIEVDEDAKAVKDGKTTKLNPRLTIGADGAYSAVRGAMLRQSRASYSRMFIPHSYKEFDIPPLGPGEKVGDPVKLDSAGASAASGAATGGAGLEPRYRLPEPNSLHIWPRHEFMLIALPNPTGSFTCTLFAPNSTFKQLDEGGDEAVCKFFKTNFPDVTPAIGDVEQQYRDNPAGSLVTVRVKPWNIGSRALLIGDAAHAVVPFYGQGMNAAFEDALMLDETLTECGGDLDEAVKKFAKERQPAADGLADLSFGNYAEMASHTAHSGFLIQKKVEGLLERMAPKWWIPLYSMVSFERVPYHEAKARGERQDAAMAWAFSAGLAAATAAAGITAWQLAAKRGAVSVSPLQAVRKGLTGLASWL